MFRGALSLAALVLAALLGLAGARRTALGVALVAAVSLSSVAAETLRLSPAEAAPGGLVHYQKNLLWLLPDTAPVATDIRAAAPDIVTLQEVHERNRPMLDALADDYPTQVVCPFRRVGGVAVLSRWPAVEGSLRCAEGEGFVAVRIRSPAGEVTVVSIHLHWPWPHGQPGQVARLLPDLELLPRPVVIGGDFNMVRWSATLGRIAEAAGAAPVGRSHVTFPIGPGDLTGLSIDHVLGPDGAGQVETRPRFGSDHRGLLARIALSPRP